MRRDYPASDTSQPARYARAIAAYLAADIQSAMKDINSLIAEEPENPYFHELKGQILFERPDRRVGRAPQTLA